MIKVPENGREGACLKVGAKALLAVLCGSFPKAFQRGEYMALGRVVCDNKRNATGLACGNLKSVSLRAIV